MPPVTSKSKPRLQTDSVESSDLERAREAQEAQLAQLEATPLESQYSAAFAAQIEAKHDQVGRIEDRLEYLVEQQSSRLQQTLSQQPGLLSRGATRARWEQRIQDQRSSIQRLQGRLEAVREIKDGMGLHSPRIEELAARKVRTQHPELAADWQDMQEARRRHEEVLRRQALAKRREQDSRQRIGGASGHTLSMTENPPR